MRAFKRVLKILGLILALILLATAGFAAYVSWTGIPKYPVKPVELKVEATPARVARGRVIAGMLCMDCHLDRTTGRLSGKRMLDLPPDFGKIWSRNITRDPVHGIGGWSDGQIAWFLRTGIKPSGQYVPPYMPKFPRASDEDLFSIIAWLRSDDSLVAPSPAENHAQQISFLTKFLSHVAFKPFAYPDHPVPSVPKDDRVAYGRYIVQDLVGCYACHSASFKTMDDLHPEKSAGYLGGGNTLMDLSGNVIRSANITMDSATGIGSWSEADFIRAVRDGHRPDGRVLRYPMNPMPGLDTADLRAVYAYLKTAPVIRNPIDRGFAEFHAAATDGHALYQKYGCVSCHGVTGKGVGDLTLCARDFPSDSGLKAWIQDPGSIRPGTKMPSFRGAIADGEYPALIAYVRQLASAR